MTSEFQQRRVCFVFSGGRGHHVGVVIMWASLLVKAETVELFENKHLLAAGELISVKTRR